MVIVAPFVPEDVQTPVVRLENTTGLPEAPPVAAAVYVGPPTTALVGAVDVNAMVWLPFPTLKLWVTWGAGLKVAFPAWSAATMQVPTATIVIVAPFVPELVQTPEVKLEKVTVSPELAVAVAV
jgi:hypothetical protein